MWQKLIFISKLSIYYFFYSQRNKNYETLCQNRLGNDLYVERMMQTINGAPKNKDVQCDKILKEDKGNFCYILLGKLPYFNIHPLGLLINNYYNKVYKAK